MIHDMDSKGRTDERVDQRFEQEKAELHKYMEANPARAQWVKKYVLKRLLEMGEKRDYGWRELVVKDTDHIQKVHKWKVKVDVYEAYQSEVLSELKNDLFTSLNAVEKHTIATSFDDVSTEIDINGEKYERNFDKDSWDSYFEKNNINPNLSQNIQKEFEVMDKIAEILYGKKYNDLFNLCVNPEKTKKLKPGIQLDLFEK